MANIKKILKEFQDSNLIRQLAILIFDDSIRTGEKIVELKLFIDMNFFFILKSQKHVTSQYSCRIYD